MNLYCRRSRTILSVFLLLLPFSLQQSSESLTIDLDNTSFATDKLSHSLQQPSSLKHRHRKRKRSAPLDSDMQYTTTTLMATATQFDSATTSGSPAFIVRRAATRPRFTSTARPLTDDRLFYKFTFYPNGVIDYSLIFLYLRQVSVLRANPFYLEVELYSHFPFYFSFYFSFLCEFWETFCTQEVCARREMINKRRKSPS